MTHLFHSASALLQQLNRGELTSRELLEQLLERQQQYNADLNAIVALDLNSARQQADHADKVRLQGRKLGPLHGLPITIKDTFEVVGMPCTAGSRSLREHRPQTDALAVQALKQAGAIIFGKTNVPVFASDIQSYNQVYGTTHNPWDLQRTPGGSSGGAAAALAAGMTPLELGSDLAGSIRTPAHFCGVYGHKPTHGLISMQGHIPGPPGTLAEADLAVAGPMARSAEDLELMLDVIAGPSPQRSPGWHLSLPRPKQKRLSDFRVLMWLDDPLCPIEQALRDHYQHLFEHLTHAGVQVRLGKPQDLSLSHIYPLYLNLLGSLVGAAMKPPDRVKAHLTGAVMAKLGKPLGAPTLFHHYTHGAVQSHAEWLHQHEKRTKMQRQFCREFEHYDVILSPVALSTAFKHQQNTHFALRKLAIDGRKRHYTDLFIWVSPASLFGLPATSAPIRPLPQGLPCNVQIIGAPYQDRLTLRFAALLAKLSGGFTAPPGYLAT